MKPCEIPLEIFRGATFQHEFITQVKKYVYDPLIHTNADDLQRTYAENLKHHGFTWEFVNFLGTYASAELIVIPAHAKSGDTVAPLDTFTSGAGELVLTARSVVFGLTPAKTLKLAWTDGRYKLKLTTAGGVVDCLAFGAIKVYGDKS